MNVTVSLYPATKYFWVPFTDGSMAKDATSGFGYVEIEGDYEPLGVKYDVKTLDKQELTAFVKSLVKRKYDLDDLNITLKEK